MTFNKVKIFSKDSESKLEKAINNFITGVQSGLADPDSLIILSVSFTPIITTVRLPDGSDQIQGQFYGTVLYSYDIEEEE